MAYELIKVSELPELTTPSDPNVLPIQDGDYLKRISFANLKDAAVGDMEGSLAAAYDSTATYAVGDYCIYEGQLYRCTTAIATAEAWTAGHWTAAVLTDDIASDLSTEASTRSTNDNALAADIAEALGDLAAVYSSSATYAVGDYCTKDGQLYRCTTAITTAEAWTAAHWSAVALGDDTRDLKSALMRSNSAYIQWQSGTISGGTEQTSATRIRSAYLDKGIISLKPNNGYKYYIHAFSGNVWQGAWNGSAIASSGIWQTGEISISILPSNYDYRLVLAKSNDAAISVSDGSNMIATVIYDGQYAKAKANINSGSIFDFNIIKGNITPLAQDITNGYFYKDANNQLKYTASNDYFSFFLPVASNKIYYANAKLRFVVLLDASYAPTADNQIEGVRQFNASSNAIYAAVSVDTENCPTISELIISENEYASAKMIVDAPYVLKDYLGQARNQRYAGGYDSAISLDKYPNTLKKGVRIFMSCDVSEIGEGEITVSFYSDTINADSLKYTVTASNLTSQRYGVSASPQAHGLTIENNVQMEVDLNAGDNKIKVILTSNGQTYVREFTNNANPSYNCYPKLTATAPISNISFSWQCEDLLKDVWAFGDSYFSFDSDKRWTYYLNQSGIMKNILIAGFAGDTSIGEFKSLKSLLYLGTPKYMLWATGMNDGTDGDSSPNNAWLTSVQKVLEICSQNGITPILATIPTVPTINHEKKNEWVRASGYRYIDFAKAVGAQSDGTWFDGMLETTTPRVHPTESGARALYYRALADFPELAINN